VEVREFTGEEISFFHYFWVGFFVVGDEDNMISVEELFEFVSVGKLRFFGKEEIKI